MWHNGSAKMIQEQSENREMIDEIEALLQLGWSAGAIRLELLARGFGESVIDRMIAFSFRDISSEKLELDALQHAKNEREQVEMAGLADIEEALQSQNRQKREDADALSIQQDDLDKVQEDYNLLVYEESRRIEEENAVKRSQQQVDDYQNDMEKKLRPEEAEDKRLRYTTIVLRQLSE
jgi:hypothetical protein